MCRRERLFACVCARPDCCAIWPDAMSGPVGLIDWMLRAISAWIAGFQTGSSDAVAPTANSDSDDWRFGCSDCPLAETSDSGTSDLVPCAAGPIIMLSVGLVGSSDVLLAVSHIAWKSEQMRWLVF